MIVVEQPIHRMPEHCRFCPNVRRSFIMRDGSYCKLTGRTPPDEGRAEWCPMQKVTVIESCAGCQFSKGAERCNTCSRKYLDRFSPPPPPKKPSHAARVLMAQLLCHAAVMDYYANGGKAP